MRPPPRSTRTDPRFPYPQLFRSPQPQNRPLWFGGDPEAPLKRIAKWGDGWSPFLTPPEKFPEALDYIQSQPDYHGRPIELFFPIEAMKLGEGHVENTAAAETIGSWNVQATIDLCGWLAELGVTETIIHLPQPDVSAAYLERPHWTAAEIMPKVE